MNYWLIKSEGDCYSIDDLKKDKRTAWEGVRNFQARNYMKQMRVGDRLLFHHSNGTPQSPTGIYGIAQVVAAAHIDESAFNPKDEHYDPKAVKYAKEGKEPLWECVDVAFVRKFPHALTLQAIKSDKLLRNMVVAQQGSRLSVTPVEKAHFERVVELGSEMGLPG
jgi:predicted RNA-binding protein with PUA-like domain